MTDRIKWSDPVTGLDGVIAAAKALRDGKKVQCWKSDSWFAWGQYYPLRASDKYRIGEEVKPREFWLNVYDDGVAHIYESREKADQSSGHGRLECIHMREVIE